MKSYKGILAVILCIILAMGLFSCSKKAPANLEEFINSEEAGDDTISSIASIDPNAQVEIEENTIVFTYVIEDESITEEMLVNQLSSLGDTFSGIITDLETRTGLDGINVRVTYVDGSGNEITGKVFE